MKQQLMNFGIVLVWASMLLVAGSFCVPSVLNVNAAEVGFDEMLSDEPIEQDVGEDEPEVAGAADEKVIVNEILGGMGTVLPQDEPYSVWESGDWTLWGMGICGVGLIITTIVYFSRKNKKKR